MKTSYLLVLGLWTVRVDDIAVLIYIPSIEQFIILITHFPPICHVRSNIIEIAQSPGKLNVCSIVQSCVPEDAYPVLGPVSKALVYERSKT